MKLGARISICVVGVVVLALASSGLALYAAWETNGLMRGITTTNLPSVRAAEEVEIALLEQSVAIAGFLLDQGNRDRLNELDRTRAAFDHWSAKAQAVSQTDNERERLARLIEVYRRYDQARAQAVDVYDDGKPEEAKRLLDEMTRLYHEAFRLCEQFIAANEQAVVAATEKSDRRMRDVIWTVGISAGLTVGLAAALLWLFIGGILRPLRSLLSEVREQLPGTFKSGAAEEELHVVGTYLRRVLLDMQDTKTALEKSRAQLLLAERLASVGKLAASVAHEIRNPLTAVKMWLFSARESLGRAAQEDRLLQRIEDEIHRLETIIRHFLEFARPPELRFRSIPLDGVLNDSLELARPLMMEKDVRVVRPDGALGVVLDADREQLIQVFSNLFYNAIQAMRPGGTLQISITSDAATTGAPAAVNVRVADSGAGIAAENQDRLFEPFFSTRSDGTGLGLCIAASIVAHHHGHIALESTGSAGSTFVVHLPLAERKS